MALEGDQSNERLAIHVVLAHQRVDFSKRLAELSGQAEVEITLGHVERDQRSFPAQVSLLEAAMGSFKHLEGCGIPASPLEQQSFQPSSP